MKVTIKYGIGIEGKATKEEVKQIFATKLLSVGILLSEEINIEDKFAIIIKDYAIEVSEGDDTAIE
jgi:hypothetical protein